MFLRHALKNGSTSSVRVLKIRYAMLCKNYKLALKQESNEHKHNQTK